MSWKRYRQNSWSKTEIPARRGSGGLGGDHRFVNERVPTHQEGKIEKEYDWARSYFTRLPGTQRTPIPPQPLREFPPNPEVDLKKI